MPFHSQIEPCILEALCKGYDLGAPRKSTPLNGTRNRNYLVRSERGKWFVRHRYAGYAQPDRMRFDHEALRFLNANGIPVVPPLPSADGNSFTICDDTVWEVYPFIEGVPMREGMHGLVKELGAAIASFHEAARHFPLRYNKLAPRGETEPAVILQQAMTIENECTACTPVLRRYRAWVSDAESELPDAAFSALPQTLVHGDLQPANILMDKNRLAAFVDLDWCAWQPRIYDLAFAILFCCSTHETRIRGEDVWSLTQPFAISPESVAVFLQSYESRTPPLSDQEMRALHAQIILSWCHSRIAGALKVPSEDRSAFLTRPPENLDEREFPAMRNRAMP